MEPQGAVQIERRPSMQDLVRRYTVFIDDQAVGRIGAFQKRTFSLGAGQHRVQLKIVNTGTSASAGFDVDVRAGETRILRTHRHTPKEYLEAPLGIIAPDKFAPRPWIGLELLDR